MNKRLNTDKPGTNWKWIYRIIDGSYRVHTRLYHVHSAIVHTEKTLFDLLGTILITSNGVTIAAIIGLIALYIQITGITLPPKSYLTLSLLICAWLLVFGYQFKQAGKIKNQLLETSREINRAPLETWPAYLGDEAVKWGTRILMAKEILEEIENLPPKDQDESAMTTKTNFTCILEESIDALKEIIKTCEEGLLKTEYHANDETIQICKEFIENGEKFIEKGESV